MNDPVLENLIQEYNYALYKYDSICKRLEVYYDEPLTTLLNNGDIESAKKLALECPDGVLGVLMLDRIKHFERK